MPDLAAPSVVHGIMRQPSLVDFPGQIAVLMFTSGCNFRCGFCHNPDLIGAVDAKTYTYGQLQERLEKCRRDWVRAVSLSGGEPTVHANLPETLEFFREQGFKVKLDTNGSNPEMLERVLPLVDYVAMDVKCAPEHYAEFVHVGHVEAIRASIALIVTRARDYEFRTTVLESRHTPEEIRAMAPLLQGAKSWIFQAFLPHDNLPDERCRGLQRPRPSVLEACAQAAREAGIAAASVR